MRRAGRWVVGVCTAALAVGLSGCASSSDKDAAATTAPAGLERYYSQQLDWKGCKGQPEFSSGSKKADAFSGLDDLECAWLTVPLDYADPSGETIRLAVARSTAKHSRGSVVFNPGGPGGSGVETVSMIVDGAGDSLVDSLDVVGFDPRGVGRSAPVDCLDDADLDAYLASDVDPSTEVGLEQARTQLDEFVAGCAELTGPVLAHVDTVSAARDMDVLRAALREPTLTYLGISYCTKLGATYAQLFPDRVGRMVLDGAVDPTLTPHEETVVQAAGFESALRAYVEDCLTDEKTCPLSGSVDEAMAQVADVVDQARAHPMHTAVGTRVTGVDRTVTGATALSGIIAALYSEETWTLLSQALDMAMVDQDGTLLAAMADVYASRCDGFSCPVEDGYYGNIQEAIVAISCADAPRDDADPQVLAERAQEIVAAAPTLGRFFAEGVAEGLDSCEDWPTVVGPLPSYAAEGAAPIVVIGTTNDPATPYVWAQDLAAMLDSGVLVTNKGEGHGGYVDGTRCLQTAVDDYLVDGKVPEDGLTCSD